MWFRLWPTIFYSGGTVKKKSKRLDIKQKMLGSFLVTIVDEDRLLTYLPGVDFDYIFSLYKNPNVDIIKIETIENEFYRPEDVTEQTLKKLAGGKNG
jgi:hypothetical protein